MTRTTPTFIPALALALGICSMAGCDGSVIGGGGGAGGWTDTDGGAAAPDGGGMYPDSGAMSQPDLLAKKPETCNGLDDDLDGQVDEGCSCKPKSTQACFPGQAAQLQGLCKKGTQTCTGTGEFGTWGPCTGAVKPVAEKCGDGIDQDCDGKDLPCPKRNHCDNFTFGQSARPIDIVFAIDQSGSMNSDIQNVRNNMNSFAKQIAGAKVDYRVTLIATRSSGKNKICIPPPLGGANCADNTRFKQIDKYVGSHSALSNIVQNISTIEGFMRPGSVRRFVVVTDDEAKGTTSTTFHAFLKARTGYKDYKFHSIVALVDKGCAADDGKHYIALSNWTGGIKVHICSANYGAVFTQLAQEAKTASSELTLKKTPVKGTIKVTFNGKPSTEGKQWTFDAANNKVVLKQPYPQNGAKIKVCYEW